MSSLLLLVGSGPIPTSTPLTGEYYNTYDFGVVINKVIINVSWTETIVFGTGDIVPYIYTSLDGITFAPPVQTASLYAENVRYAFVDLFFFAANHSSAVKLSNFKIQLSVQNEGDSGSVNALSTDALGTRVTFNKTFQAIDSITLTPISTTTAFAAYSNADATGFNVFVWDQSGARITRTVTWIARGVV